jgi:hypothetical protein
MLLLPTESPSVSLTYAHGAGHVLGKTTLVLQKALCAAKGLPFLGQAPYPTPRRVLVWNHNDHRQLLTSKLAAISADLGIRAWPPELAVISADHVDLPVELSWRERDQRLLDAIAASARAHRADLIIVDDFCSPPWVDAEDDLERALEVARWQRELGPSLGCDIENVLQPNMRFPKRPHAFMAAVDGWTEIQEPGERRLRLVGSDERVLNIRYTGTLYVAEAAKDRRSGEVPRRKRPCAA